MAGEEEKGFGGTQSQPGSDRARGGGGSGKTSKPESATGSGRWGGEAVHKFAADKAHAIILARVRVVLPLTRRHPATCSPIQGRLVRQLFLYSDLILG